MIDKPDPAKDAGRPDAPGVKRPHATLDLKATEVKPGAAPAAGASSASTASSGKPSADPKAPGTASSSEAAAKASAASSAASGKPGAGTPPKPAPEAPAGAKPGAGTSPPPRSGGGFLSHLAAGVVGGGLVYGGAALLGPGAVPIGTHDAAPEIEARISAVETVLRESADLNAKIGNTESRLAKLDEIERRVAALGEAQGTLEAQTRTLAERGEGAASAERLQKLEEQLALIAAGAPDGGSQLPELTAITGKIAELESTLNARIESLGASQSAEADERLAAAIEASEAATSAALRLDRDLAEVRSGQTGATRSAEAAKADAERLSTAFESVRQETDRLQSAVGELRAALDTGLKSAARPADVTAALGPVTSKLAELEQNLASVVKSEQSRRENAERIVLALELANLKRALDRGQGHGYAAELSAVEQASQGELDLSALERFKERGVATPAELKAEFRPVMNAVIDAEQEPADGSVIDRLLAGAKSVVRVRRVSHDPSDKSAEAVVSRIEAALDSGRLGDVIAEAGQLSRQAQAAMEDWLIKVTARHSVDSAIARVEDRLKAALSGAPEPEPDPAVAPDAAAPAAPAESN